MAEDATYGAILAELLEDRANIDRMIEWVQKKMGPNAERSLASTPLVHPQPETAGSNHYFKTRSHLAVDSFFRMSVQDAITKFLNLSKRPRTAKDITEGLAAGGLTHKSQNLYATVYPTLLRMERNNEVARAGKREWGLSEWYGGRKTITEEKSETDK